MAASVCDIFQAITRENTTELTSLLKTSKLNLKCAFRNTTPLSFAIYRGHLPSVRVLLQHGAPVDQRSADHLQRLETPIISAIRLGHTDIVKELLSSGSNVDLCDFYGRTALWQAVKEQKLTIVQLLLQKGAKIDFEKVSQSPLVMVFPYICYEVRRNLAIELIKSGLDVNVQDSEGRTPLFWAIHHNDFHLFTFLLEAGATLSRGDKDLKCPKSWMTEPHKGLKIMEERSTPRSLEKQCRKVIRNYLLRERKTDIRPFLSSIQLPKPLIQFLLLI